MADSDGKEKKGRCQAIGDGFSNFAKFLFNKETGQVMGRSGESWLKIGAFYLIFYGFLAAFFSAMLTVFLSTLNDPGKGGPKLVQFLENKPGMSYMSLGIGISKFPLTPNVNSTEIILNNYKKKVDDMFKKYKDFESTNNDVEFCKDSDKDGMEKLGRSCRFNTELLGDCGGETGSNSSYGLELNKPCVYVRVNKVYGWVPKGPKEKPEYLKLICSPKEAVQLFPKDGFQIAAFPFLGQEGFELPVVAVQIDTTKTKEVVCYLKGEGDSIEVSESSIPHRAFSKVKIS